MANLGHAGGAVLEYSHEMGVVHRDIKPANLLLDGRGNLWITDFGLAHCQSVAGLTMTGDLVGTLRYMSPEQALAQRVGIDHRTDIYSLGATLYELLTLEPVFTGADRQELLRQIAFEEPIGPRRHNKSIPAELETIVLKALEKNPADRYATAKEMADDLERFTKDEPIRARRPSLGRRLRGWCRRHKPLVTGMAVLILTVALLGGAILWRREAQNSATAQVVETDLKEAEVLRDQQQWAKAVVSLERAKGRLEGSGLTALQARVEEHRREVRLVDQIEKARMQMLQVPGRDDRDFAGADRLYAAAFAENGMDLTALAPQEAVRLLEASAIHAHLVRALDNWAYCKDHLPKGDGKPLRDIAQATDHDPWRRSCATQPCGRTGRRWKNWRRRKPSLNSRRNSCSFCLPFWKMRRRKRPGYACSKRRNRSIPMIFGSTISSRIPWVSRLRPERRSPTAAQPWPFGRTVPLFISPLPMR